MKMLTFCLLLAFSVLGCIGQQHSMHLTSIQILDRNGFKQTITSPDRLKMHQKTNFSSSHPYAKVVRIYARDQNGKIPSRLTTYHPNGEVWQYLEVVSGRAYGLYREWHPNGKLHFELTVIEGLGDLSEEAQMSWVFDGVCRVWDEQGCLKAEFNYEKGLIQGLALYYFPNGKLEQHIPYDKGEINGDSCLYNLQGDLIGKSTFCKGKQHGFSTFKGDEHRPPYTEFYQEGLLIEGSYYDFLGKITARVEKGFGKKAIFSDGYLQALEEYQSGVLEGEVQIFHKQGPIVNSFCIKEGKKQGREWVYYPTSDKQPKLCITWVDDKIHGLSTTWSSNGKLESQREMYENQKHGVSSAWYTDGTLRLLEEYDHDQLMSGKYFEKGSPEPVSQVEKGEGTVTLYDMEGLFLKQICYEKGKPVLNSSSSHFTY